MSDSKSWGSTNAPAVPLRPARAVVTVFGASWAKPGSELYSESETLGRLVAGAGLSIMNGGYGGTMEGSAKGATEAGGEAEGVIVSALFRQRDPRGSAYLTRVTDKPTLLTRIEHMIHCADFFVILPGTLGTLAEACCVWNVAALSGFAGQPPPLIVAYRKPWQHIILECASCLDMPKEHAEMIHFVDSAHEAVAAIVAERARRQAAADAAASAASAGESSGAAAMPST